MIPIKYTKWGIANNFGDHIELNESLKLYPRLHEAILNHELSHTDKPFSKKDLMLDLGESKVKTWDMILFIAKNPRSITQFLPFYWTKEYGLVYDINLILLYFVIGFLIAAGLILGNVI